MAETKKEALKPGMYNVVMTTKSGRKGEKRVYHSSTAQTLSAKGFLTVGEPVEKYVPKGAKE